MLQANHRLVSFQEIVKDWAIQNGCEGQCSVREADTVDRPIQISATGMPDPLEFPNPPEMLSRPARGEEKERVRNWLRAAFKK